MADQLASMVLRKRPTVIAVLCACLVSSTSGVGVVARLRDKLAMVPFDLSLDKGIHWDRWDWLGEHESNSKPLSMVKRGVLLQALKTAAAQENYNDQVRQVDQDEAGQPDKMRLAADIQLILSEFGGNHHGNPKRNQDSKTASNGKRGRLNRPVIHAG